MQYTITLKNTNEKVNGVINVIDEIPAGTEFVSATRDNLETIPAEYQEPKQVKSLEWKNVEVEAGSEIALVVYVKVVAKIEAQNETDTRVVQNIAKIYDGTTPEQEVQSSEIKVANITANKTSKIIYNTEKPHEHKVENGIEPLHEQDIIEYTITLTNVGEAEATVKVSDTIPKGTTLVKNGKVTVTDKNGTTTHKKLKLIEGIDVTVPAINDGVAGVATITFRVIVNSFDEQSKTIKNDMAKVDGNSTNTTEDKAEKVKINIPVTKIWKEINNDAARANSINAIKIQIKNEQNVVAEKIIAAVASDINYVRGTNNNLDTTEVTMTNTFELEVIKNQTTTKTIKKIWEDQDNKAQERPQKVVLTLNGIDHELTAENDEDQTTPNEWTLTINNLQKYNADGTEIVYTATEPNVPEGYTKTENGLIVTNTADVIVEKEAYKTNADGTIGEQTTETDKFGAGDIIYYTITLKNAGNTTIDTTTLTDTLSLRLELLAIDATDEITENTVSGTDNNGYTWTLSKDSNGNTVIDWILTDVKPGETKQLTIKTRIPIHVEHRDLTSKYGDTTQHAATLYIRKDGKVPYIGSGLSENEENYTSALGTVYLNIAEPIYDMNANLINDDIYHVLENNNAIVDMVSRGISRTELIRALSNNGITLGTDEIVLWYTAKHQDGQCKIYGIIKKVTDTQLTRINNAILMDNIEKAEETINIEEIVIEQAGTVTIHTTTTTTETVSTPMDVVFVLDVSGSMDGNNAIKMVNAVNNSIKTIMAKNAETRIGIVAFSDEVQVIVPLAKYPANINYLTHSREGYIFTYSKITENVTGYSNGVYTYGATYTQAGIKKGAEMLIAEETTTFTATVGGTTVSGTRTPVLVLITDGEPTYSNNQPDLSGTVSGNGSDEQPEHYYWTIRTAKYYKDAVTEKYYKGTNKEAKMFTIGIDLNNKSAITMLNPNETNVNICRDAGESDKENKNAKSLYNLLNSQHTPYAYDYADKTHTGAISESDLENFLTTSLEASSGTMVVRAITMEETINRRIDLVHMNENEEFSLEIKGETTLSYNSLTQAKEAQYVKYDSIEQVYYVDLTNIEKQTTVNISYYHK